MKKITSRLARQSIKKSFLRFLFAALLVCGVVATASISFRFLDPVGFRTHVFQPIREIAYFQKELAVLPQWNGIEKVAVPSPAHAIILSNEGLRIVADLWVPTGQGPTGAILMLHGSSRYGRKAGLIRYMAFRFRDAGWIVLAPDARGFGETDDPKDIANPVSWNSKEDVKRCLDYLAKHSRTDCDRIYVIGHSMGAAHALGGALDDPRVDGVVLIGPPRYPEGTKTAYSIWNLARFSADRHLQRPIAEEVMKARVLEYLSQLDKNLLENKEHIPILLIDGELEGQLNLTYLAGIARKISPPILYQTLPDTGHYCGVYNFFGSNVIYYRPDLFNPFMHMVLDFFRKIEDGTIRRQKSVHTREGL